MSWLGAFGESEELLPVLDLSQPSDLELARDVVRNAVWSGYWIVSTLLKGVPVRKCRAAEQLTEQSCEHGYLLQIGLDHVHCRPVQEKMVVLSYRWSKDRVRRVADGSTIALYEGMKDMWVDCMNHLNDPDAKDFVMNSMGTLFSENQVHLSYYIDNDEFWEESASRGWMLLEQYGVDALWERVDSIKKLEFACSYAIPDWSYSSVLEDYKSVSVPAALAIRELLHGNMRYGNRPYYATGLAVMALDRCARGKARLDMNSLDGCLSALIKEGFATLSSLEVEKFKDAESWQRRLKREAIQSVAQMLRFQLKRKPPHMERLRRAILHYEECSQFSVSSDRAVASFAMIAEDTITRDKDVRDKLSILIEGVLREHVRHKSNFSTSLRVRRMELRGCRNPLGFNVVGLIDIKEGIDSQELYGKQSIIKRESLGPAVPSAVASGLFEQQKALYTDEFAAAAYGAGPGKGATVREVFVVLQDRKGSFHFLYAVVQGAGNLRSTQTRTAGWDTGVVKFLTPRGSTVPQVTRMGATLTSIDCEVGVRTVSKTGDLYSKAERHTHVTYVLNFAQSEHSQIGIEALRVDKRQALQLRRHISKHLRIT